VADEEHGTVTDEPHGRPSDWALELFRRSLKKRQKLELLQRMLGALDGERCLLVTCGDNSGALNHHFREQGGSWTWAEMDPGRIGFMAAVLGEPVHQATSSQLPFPDASFQRVVVIDVHEHLEDTTPVNREIFRILAPGGVAILTTPNGNPRLPLAVLKRLLGMTPEVYGHRVQGYTAQELENMARKVGLVPEARGAYSRFFTEAIELVINLAYVKVLRGDGDEMGGSDGEIAPSTPGELEEVGWAYRLYRFAYPLLRAISSLDHLLPGDGGYAVAIRARRPR